MPREGSRDQVGWPALPSEVQRGALCVGAIQHHDVCSPTVAACVHLCGPTQLLV